MGRWLLRTKGRKEEELKQNIWGFPSLLSSQRIESTLSTDDIFFIENPSFLIICCWFLWFAGEESRNRVKDVFAPSFDFHLPNQWSQCTKCNGDQPGKLRWWEKTTRYDINQDRDGDSIVFAENHHSNLYKRNHFTRLLKSPSLQQTALLMSMSRGSFSCTGYT